MPNYFGEQRFGHNNIQQATAWLTGATRVRDRTQQGRLLSVARSLLFNQILAMRVAQQSWQQLLTGDVVMLAGSHSVFVVDEVDEPLQQRLIAHDIHPTGALWGVGEPMSRGCARALELAAVAPLVLLQQGLERAEVKQQRRSLVALPQELSWDYQKETHTLKVSFYLAAGCYATSLLRERPAIINRA
ncbi:MAG: tRNA pseudouridine13 synthase [Halothiobacillaceae bacterium]|nr:MAG: tRNA pseudouridine13 synthase [Halothiobacillaceae bacterium]